MTTPSIPQHHHWFFYIWTLWSQLSQYLDVIAASNEHVTCDMWNGWICLLSKWSQNPDFSCHQNTQLFWVWSANSFVGEYNSQGIFQLVLLMMAVVMMAPLTKGEIRWNLWLAMSWVGGREQVGALRSWQPALQSRSITTILRQMHLRSSLLELSPGGDIWDQRGNLGRSGVASSAAPLLPDQKGGKFIWVTTNQQCHSTHIKSSHQPRNWVLRSFLGYNMICLQDWGSSILKLRFLNLDSTIRLQVWAFRIPYPKKQDWGSWNLRMWYILDWFWGFIILWYIILSIVEGREINIVRAGQHLNWIYPTKAHMATTLKLPSQTSSTAPGQAPLRSLTGGWDKGGEKWWLALKRNSAKWTKRQSSDIEAHIGGCSTLSWRAHLIQHSFYSAAYIEQCIEPGRSHFTFCVCVLWICVSVHLCTYLQCVEPGGSYFPASSTIIRPASSPPLSQAIILCSAKSTKLTPTKLQRVQVHTHTQKIVLLESRLAIFVVHCSPSNST